MSLKIGTAFIIRRSPSVRYTVQGYQGGSIGIRGRVSSGEDLKPTEVELYQLREGSVHEIEIETDDHQILQGSYTINELNWKKERQANGDYELFFNIGLQRRNRV